MARRENEKTKTDNTDSVDNGLVINTCSTSNQIYYELAGVVVHSGQANAGHYYSFIKDRRSAHGWSPCSVQLILVGLNSLVLMIIF